MASKQRYDEVDNLFEDDAILCALRSSLCETDCYVPSATPPRHSNDNTLAVTLGHALGIHLKKTCQFGTESLANFLNRHIYRQLVLSTFENLALSNHKIDVRDEEVLYNTI